MADSSHAVPPDADGIYPTLREPLACFLGQRLVDITTTDKDEVRRGEPNVVTLLFDNGASLTFPVTAAGLSFETVD